MRLYPKMPETTFWRKWSMYCIMFTGSCLLTTRFFKDVPDVVDSAETLMWFGGAGLALGIFMQYWQSRKKDK